MSSSGGCSGGVSGMRGGGSEKEIEPSDFDDHVVRTVELLAAIGCGDDGDRAVGLDAIDAAAEMMRGDEAALKIARHAVAVGGVLLVDGDAASSAPSACGANCGCR